MKTRLVNRPLLERHFPINSLCEIPRDFQAGVPNPDLFSGTFQILGLSFLVFLLRQVYPDSWEKLRGKEEVSNYCRNVRDDLDRVDEAYWSELDERELILR